MARRSTKRTTGSGELDDKVYVATSDDAGKGVFAKISFKKGDFIGTYQGPAAKRNGKYVLWLVGRGKVVGRRGLNALRHLNHADRPNAEFDGWDLYATKRIPRGSEITCDYDPNEGAAS
jgi:hypothetical protein